MVGRTWRPGAAGQCCRPRRCSRRRCRRRGAGSRWRPGSRGRRTPAGTARCRAPRRTTRTPSAPPTARAAQRTCTLCYLLRPKITDTIAELHRNNSNFFTSRQINWEFGSEGGDKSRKILKLAYQLVMGRVPEPEPEKMKICYPNPNPRNSKSSTRTRTRKNRKIKPEDTILNTY